MVGRARASRMRMKAHIEGVEVCGRGDDGDILGVVLCVYGCALARRLEGWMDVALMSCDRLEFLVGYGCSGTVRSGGGVIIWSRYCMRACIIRLWRGESEGERG